MLTGDTLGHLLMVADGMGGHRAGNEASSLAVHYFLASILNKVRWHTLIQSGDDSHLVEDLKEMLRQAHDLIVRKSAEEKSLSGMGTTLTMAYIVWPRMVVLHAGDTRCYLLRDGKLQLLTHDHTLAEEMMRRGELDRNSGERSPWSNVLSNALGANAEMVHAEIAHVDLHPGDTVFLCSDGLNKHVSDERIAKELLHGANVSDAVTRLVRLAIEGGGSDNITALAAKWISSIPERYLRVSSMLPSDTKIFTEVEHPDLSNEVFETTSTGEIGLSTIDFQIIPTPPPRKKP
jgi:protein phosphatase